MPDVVAKWLAKTLSNERSPALFCHRTRMMRGDLRAMSLASGMELVKVDFLKNRMGFL